MTNKTKQIVDKAMKLYEAGSYDFSVFTDNELYELYKTCVITERNPYGAAYDDEVFDEIYNRHTADGKELMDVFSEKYKAEYLDEIVDRAMELYNAGVYDFSVFTDYELYELYKTCLMTEENWAGAAYDDEVFDEIYNRHTADGRELIDVFKEMYKKEMPEEIAKIHNNISFYEGLKEGTLDVIQGNFRAYGVDHLFEFNLTSNEIIAMYDERGKETGYGDRVEEAIKEEAALFAKNMYGSLDDKLEAAEAKSNSQNKDINTMVNNKDDISL